MEKVTKTYRLEEMKDAMEQSILNAKEVVNQQIDLVDLVKNSPQNEMFKAFIDESEAQIQDLKIQINTLEKRQDYLESVIYMIDNDIKVEEAIDKFMLAIGMFEE